MHLRESRRRQFAPDDKKGRVTLKGIIGPVEERSTKTGRKKTARAWEPRYPERRGSRPARFFWGFFLNGIEYFLLDCIELNSIFPECLFVTLRLRTFG